VRRQHPRLFVNRFWVAVNRPAMFRAAPEGVDVGIRGLQEIVQKNPRPDFQSCRARQYGVGRSGRQDQCVESGARAVAGAGHLSIAVDRLQAHTRSNLHAEFVEPLFVQVFIPAFVRIRAGAESTGTTQERDREPMLQFGQLLDTRQGSLARAGDQKPSHTYSYFEVTLLQGAGAIT